MVCCQPPFTTAGRPAPDVQCEATTKGTDMPQTRPRRPITWDEVHKLARDRALQLAKGDRSRLVPVSRYVVRVLNPKER